MRFYDYGFTVSMTMEHARLPFSSYTQLLVFTGLSSNNSNVNKPTPRTHISVEFVKVKIRNETQTRG